MRNRDDIKQIKKKYPELSNRIAEEMLILNAFEDINLCRQLLCKFKYYPNKTFKTSIKILYEDQNTLAVLKLSGVDSETGIDNKGLVNIVTNYINVKSANPFDIPRPVNRLDKDTEGIVLFSKNLEAHKYYSKLFKNHDLRKIYTAKVIGNFNLPLPYRIETYISDKPLNRRYYSTDDRQGKKATTIVTNAVYCISDNTSDLTLEILTGKTHQIRVHLSELGFPIVNDEIYGKKGEGKLGLKAVELQIKNCEGENILITNY